MRNRLSIALAIAALVVALPAASFATTTTTHHRPQLYGVTAPMFREAQRVATCEESGNWSYHDPKDLHGFNGGIGWYDASWVKFRRPGWPRWMYKAPPHMQANALWRFVWHYRIAMPDQGGSCAGY